MAHFDASRMLSFDLETTSADPMEARIVTSALVSIDGAQTDMLEMLADPGIEIPEEAARIHGITTEKARAEGQPHDEVLAETVRRIKKAWEEGFALVVYNAPFDLTVLRQLTGSFTVTGPVYDPYTVDNIKDRYRKGRRTLTDVSKHYGVTLDNAHEATSDAIAAARIAWKQVNKVYPDLKAMSTDELMEFQAVGYYDNQENRRKYFESRGRDGSSVNTSWPMQD
ncbi:3'-5' exonuclease [Corynebacterium guangdongense]|uniref:DNA polymerase-3 subunit epsilon n=1 Tax=Corynebacterium guangdongense TaxID=1783348 RepID=A0ABU1ZW38_9CORY|nr:3'-5' exonuclease [Corynebacterium guangdongense]MDR7329144.1 DNA polymerase-3 subunit epsilon [Corynebacterium guangdongense]WJZ17713.1 DNA polymerase III subunit epsilon [Corynebacterium guangdongense]